MNKWNYIEKISAVSDRYGDKLVLLMDKYNKSNLRDITLEEAKEFWEELESFRKKVSEIQKIKTNIKEVNETIEKLKELEKWCIKGLDISWQKIQGSLWII